MLRGTPTKGSIIYYVVNDFDGCGIFQVRVLGLNYEGWIQAVGIESSLNGVSLLLDPIESNIFSTYGEAKRYLNAVRYY